MFLAAKKMAPIIRLRTKKTKNLASRKEEDYLDEHYCINTQSFCNATRHSEAWSEFLFNKCLCDGIILSLDNEEIPVHRALISGASVHFAKLFLRSQNISHITTVAVNLPSTTIKHMVKYVYTQECDMDKNNIPALLDAAYKFKFTALFNSITINLFEKLAVTNCLGTLRILEPYSCPEVKYKTFEYIVHNFEDVVKFSYEFNDISSIEFLEILSDDELVVDDEEKLFTIIIRWINLDRLKRQKYMPALSKGIRYGLMGKPFFEREVLDSHFIRNSEMILKELEPVVLFHDQPYSTKTFNLTFARPRIPKDIVFVIGGCVQGCLTNIVETYDIVTDRWITADTVDPLVRMFYAVCNIRHVIYIVGGCDGGGHTIYNSMRSFDPVTSKWSILSCMHQCRCHNSVVALNGIVYTMGGFDGSVSLASAEAYDPNANQWTLLAPMNLSRAECASAEINGKIYVAGGCLGEEGQSSVETYNPSTNQWTDIQSMRVPRYGLSLVAYQGKLYALGGINNEERKLNTVEKLDPTRQQQEWCFIEPMSIPRNNFPAVIINNKILVVGGSTSTSLNASVEFYDDKTGDWQQKRHIALRRSAIAACVLTHLPNARDYCYLKVLDAEEESRMGPEEVTDDEQESNI